MRIGVDVDGVLADRIPTILDLIAERHGVRLSPARIAGGETPVPGTDRRLRSFFAETDEDPDHLRSLPTVDGAVAGMRALAADHELLIATYRKPVAREPTRRWLADHEIPYDDYVRDVGEGKRAVPADLLIDDSVPTARAFAAAGGRAVLFSQPWNGRPAGEGDGSGNGPAPRVVDGWPALVDLVASLAAEDD